MTRTAAIAFSVVLACCLMVTSPRSAMGQLLPNGFAYEQVVGAPYTGEPTGFAFLPDGRIVFASNRYGPNEIRIDTIIVAATIVKAEAAHPSVMPCPVGRKCNASEG